MTAVLRELVAKLGFQVDDSGFKRASAGVERLKTSVQGVDASLRHARGRFTDASGRLREANGKFVGLGGGGAGGAKGGGVKGATKDVVGLTTAVGGLQSSLVRLGASLGFTALLNKMTGLASDANETDNVLEQVFGAKGAAEVKNWAATTSKEIGRSRYTLRDYTAQVGAMLEPMVGSATKAQEMSTHISQLSVDLASFLNTADDDALLALKSGLAGETEPLRRYGIVLLDATLQEYAHSKGIQTKITKMTNAQKVELRYQYIMSHTTKAQGDAARTADGFANASRALKDNLKDLGTQIGQKLLPLAGRMIKWASQAIDGFRELASRSNIAEGALVAVAAAIAAMNAAALRDMLPAIIGMALLAAAIDEVTTTLDGGQSLMRDWIDGWAGVGTTDKLVASLKTNLEDLDGNMPDMITSWHLLADSVDDAGFAIQELLTEMKRLLTLPIAAPLQWIDKLDAKFKSLPGVKQFYARVDANLAKEEAQWTKDHPGEAFPFARGPKWYDEDNQREPNEAAYQGTLAPAATTLPQKLEQRRARRQRGQVQDQAAREEARRLRKYKQYESQSSRVRESRSIPDAGMSVAPPAPPESLISEAPLLSLPAPASAAPAVVNNITVTNGDINMSMDSSSSTSAARQATKAAQAERRRTQDALKRGG